MKKCSMCGEIKSTDCFYKLASSPSGLQSRCKSCTKSYYEDNKETLLKQHYEWVDRNRDKHNEIRKKAYWNNVEKYRNYSKKYYGTISGKLNNRVQQHKRRARKNNAIGTHTRQDIEDIYILQEGKCIWCKKSVGNKYHVDHVIPLSKGGADSKENLAISCPTCNEKKSNKLPESFHQ